MVSWLLDDGESGRSRLTGALEDELVARTAKVLGATSVARGPRSRWRADIVRAHIRESRDPERYLPAWLEEGVPTGVSVPVPPSGIFPPVATEAEASSELWRYYATGTPRDNYKSAVENAQEFAKEVERLHEAGYVSKYASLKEAQQALGHVVVSRVAAIVKLREDGTTKLRIIIDMLRSMVNSFVKLGERIILPRLMDVVTDLLALSEAAARDGTADEIITQMVADFVDAFHTLGVRLEERPYQVFKLPDGSYCGYETAVFGGGASPLTWGRAGSFVGRSSQALFDDLRARIQIYVDDPWTCWRGRPQHVRRMQATLLLWWLVLGLEVSWKKVQHGTRVKWIGAEVGIDRCRAVFLGLPEEYAEEVRLEALELLMMRSAPARRLRRLAGKAAWFSGFIPAVGAMIAPLWAGIAGATGREGDRTTRHAGDGDTAVPIIRVSHALRWLVAFCLGRSGTLTREFALEVHSSPPAVKIDFDASPWGYGAVLYWQGKPCEYFGLPISSEDVARFGVVVGDHRFQTLLENLAILIGVRHWLPAWRHMRLLVTVRSDSKAALGAWTKERSKSAAVNEVVREAALDMAEGCYAIDIRAHVEGKANHWPDLLSRLHQPGASTQLPAALRRCKRVWPSERVPTWWKAAADPLDGQQADAAVRW